MSEADELNKSNIKNENNENRSIEVKNSKKSVIITGDNNTVNLNNTDSNTQSEETGRPSLYADVTKDRSNAGTKIFTGMEEGLGKRIIPLWLIIVVSLCMTIIVAFLFNIPDKNKADETISPEPIGTLKVVVNVDGKVLDELNNSVEGATISIYEDNKEKNKLGNQISTENGYFKFTFPSEIQLEKVWIVVEMAGYHAVNKYLDVRAAQERNIIKIKALPKATHPLKVKTNYKYSSADIRINNRFYGKVGDEISLNEGVYRLQVIYINHEYEEKKVYKGLVKIPVKDSILIIKDSEFQRVKYEKPN